MIWSFARFAAIAFALQACASGTPKTAPHAEEASPRAHLKHAELLRDQARFTPALPNVDGKRDYDVEGYELSGRFNWEKLQLEGRVHVTFRLTNPEVTAIELDSRVSEINMVRIGEIQPSYTVNPDQGTLEVDLSRLTPAERQDRIQIQIAYVRKATEDADSGDHFDGSALRAIGPRLGDPVRARTVNTMSEPLSASQWMPCKDDVSDRATFAVELTLPKDESLIANGNLVKDEKREDGTRVMGYRTQYTLPTYLMAFAAGEFTVTTTELNGLPIGVWSRRGLPVDATGVVSHLSRLITRFTELVGPYPFDKYMIVFLPEFGGGEEHAGITFQNEASGTDTAGAGDLSLIGHELGHQWFGDYVTVKTWDDLWIKEGMASVLEAESNRPWEDQKGKGNLFGSFQWVDEGDAVIDPALPPDDKYTSGPYGRAAWVLTQMRALLGEDEFFATLRQVLKDHAYGTITTAEFLEAFRPGLGDANLAKIDVALRAKALPKIVIQAADDGSKSFMLTDADQALVVPLELVRLGADAVEATALVPGQSYPLGTDDGRPVHFDPKDVHSYQVREEAAKLYAHVSPPRAAADLIKLNNNDQAWAFAFDTPAWTVTAAEYTALKGQLGGEIAKAEAFRKACQTALKETDPAKKAAWAEALDATLLDLPLLGLSSWYSATSIPGDCLAAASPGVLRSTFAQIKATPNAFVTRPVLVRALASLPLDGAEMLETWSPAALGGATLRIKAAAAEGLFRRLATLTDSFATEPLANLSDWQIFFRDLVASNHAGDVLRYSVPGVTQTKDLDALPALADVVKTLDAARYQKQAVCAARKITAGDEAAFAAFAAPLREITTLAKSVKTALTDAAVCEGSR